MRILVTGANGVLGRHIVEQCRSAGMTVRALTRATSDPRPLAHLDIERVTGALVPPDNLATALDGVDAVVHCAGGGRAQNHAALRRNNRDTTAHLIDAVQRHCPDLQRFVFISSLSAQGPSPTEAPMPTPAVGQPITAYGHSKAEAEALVQQLGAHIPITIVRPPAIYGPGDWRMVPLFRAAQRGWVPIPARSRCMSLVHVQDCASAVAGVLRHDCAAGRIYTVSSGPPVTYDELIDHIGRAVGSQPRSVRIPTPLLWLVGLLGDLTGPFRQKGSLLTRDKVRAISQPYWACSNAELCQDLNWQPRFPIEQGIVQTADWYRTEGWLRAR